MKLKYDRCIHKQVCKFRPNEDYPQFMKRIVSENCKHFKEVQKNENRRNQSNVQQELFHA